MESKKMPADWAIEKAVAKWNGAHGAEILNADIVKKNSAGNPFAFILEVARYIEAHEEPPVDRKLQCAREAAASLVEWNERYAAEIRQGLHDKTCGRVVAGEMAITLYEEGFAK